MMSKPALARESEMMSKPALAPGSEMMSNLAPGRASAMRWLPRALACSITLLALVCPHMARAESKRAPARASQITQALDVARGLRGVELGRSVAVYEDVQGDQRIERISAPELAEHFTPSSEPALNFGFTRSVYWLRLTVRNSSPKARPWLLELAYPLLDDVTLYMPRASGFEARATGDRRPFDQRDIAYRNFVFSLEEPAHGARTYYLRVASGGTLNVPLVAWSMKEFVEHQHIDWSMLCIFYGVILVMACYNACVWGFTRQPEYLPYVGYIVAVFVYIFTNAGHTYQFLLPDDSALVHRLTPASAAAAQMFACAVVLGYVPERHPLKQLLRYAMRYYLGLFALSWVAPFGSVAKMVVGSALTMPFVAVAVAVVLVRSRSPEAKLFLFGWGSTLFGVTLYVLQNLGLVPRNFLSAWGVQIGVSVQLVLLSAALADKLNSARADLAALHGELSRKVGDLSAALAAAEQATERAERATRLKNEFLTIMSHEFRTPLNPIINFSQGLVHEFAPARHARCAGCGSDFLLDEDEALSEATTCPECARGGTLRGRISLHYFGDARAARAFLTKIERSGVRLLQLVNGILDFSKMEAGHLKLLRERFTIATLLAEVQAELGPRVARAGLELHCASVPANVELFADPLRLREVLGHLIDNAIKFSSGRGPVSVAVALGEQAVFSVRDRGIGVARENYERIFASFEQVDQGNTRRFGGTGLGLSIARALVRMHGGELWVESELGQGSTFFFRVPLLGPVDTLRPPSEPWLDQATEPA